MVGTKGTPETETDEARKPQKSQEESRAGTKASIDETNIQKKRYFMIEKDLSPSIMKMLDKCQISRNIEE